MRNGSALKKLEAGEVLDVLESPKEDDTLGITRAKVKSRRDGKEGFVTMNGDQGSTFIEESCTHHVSKQRVALSKIVASDSPASWTLEEGELVEFMGDPVAKSVEGAARARVRHMGSGAEGWLTLASQSLVPWYRDHKCIRETILDDVLEVGSSSTLRKIEVGEFVEALQKPVFDEAAGVLRMKVRAVRCGTVGFTTCGDGKGCLFLEPFRCHEAAGADEAADAGEPKEV